MSGRALVVAVGVPFDVEFSGPGAGFEWHLLAPPSGLELLSRILRQGSSGGSGQGHAFEQLFHLRATAAGRYGLTFSLRQRPEETPAQTEIVTVEAVVPAEA